MNRRGSGGDEDFFPVQLNLPVRHGRIFYPDFRDRADLDGMRGFLEAVRAGCPRLRALVTSTHDKFVIFSDFHMTDRMSRQDWFFRFNFKPYLEVLTRYSQDGCELIENGDVGYARYAMN